MLAPMTDTDIKICLVDGERPASAQAALEMCQCGHHQLYLCVLTAMWSAVDEPAVVAPVAAVAFGRHDPTPDIDMTGSSGGMAADATGMRMDSELSLTIAVSADEAMAVAVRGHQQRHPEGGYLYCV